MANHLPPQFFRTMVALNNIGCSLLERNMPRFAHQTFQDALMLIKLVESHATSDADDSTTFEATTTTTMATILSEEDVIIINEKLHEAEQRLSSSVAPPPPPPPPFSLTSYAMDLQCPSFRMMLKVLEEDDHVTGGKANVKSCYHPIRIDIGEFTDHLEPLEHDVSVAIILYNYGIARLLLLSDNMAAASTSLTTSGNNVNCQCRHNHSSCHHCHHHHHHHHRRPNAGRAAIHLFELSHQILLMCGEHDQVLFVAIANFDAMARALVAAAAGGVVSDDDAEENLLREAEEAEVYVSKLDELISTAQDIQRMDDDFGIPEAACAA